MYLEEAERGGRGGISWGRVLLMVLAGTGEPFLKGRRLFRPNSLRFEPHLTFFLRTAA